ncbi:MAG TPA: VTT domain-containing protein [Planctomycetota bacterium]|nr:VTT domain-containing protein [Planctomycetota bacterium]
MFDQIVGTITEYPYLGAALVFLLCGIGLPLPEEIVLLAAGYVCAKFPEHATLHWMMLWCAGAILTGDLIPYVLGRVFGVRLLRLRWLRWLVTRKRLASFDRWFRRRGDLVILIARFLAGLRIVAFFTAGTMKMSWTRFVMLDGVGIVLMVPFLSLLGYHSASFIEGLIAIVQKVERGILYGIVGGSLLVAASLWFWRRRKQFRRRPQPAEAFVEPKRPVLGESAPPAADNPLAQAAAEVSPQLAEPPAQPREALPAKPQAPSDSYTRPG